MRSYWLGLRISGAQLSRYPAIEKQHNHEVGPMASKGYLPLPPFVRTEMGPLGRPEPNLGEDSGTSVRFEKSPFDAERGQSWCHELIVVFFNH